MRKSDLTPEELRKIELLQKKRNENLIKRFILDQTEAKIKNKYSDKELDQELEKRQLTSTTVYDLWKIKGIDSKLLRTPAEYEAIFTQDYYQEIYRLNGWTYKGPIAQKPWKVGKYTNEIIYYRFSHEVLPFLRIINPFIIPGVRKFKHHQYLAPGARIELSKFISQAVDLMKMCNDWNEFRIKYCKMYDVPYQLKFSF